MDIRWRAGGTPALLIALLLLAGCATQRHLALQDVRAVARPNLKRLAVAGAAVGVARALDHTVAEHHPTGDALDHYTKLVEPFGGRYADRVIAGYAISGFLRHDEQQKNVAFDAHWLSDVVAGGIIGTTVGRTVVAVSGRERARLRVAMVGRSILVGWSW